jgi:hypothetical protein
MPIRTMASGQGPAKPTIYKVPTRHAIGAHIPLAR